MATMKAWMQRHHGERILTWQRKANDPGGWAPGPRTVDASRSTYVRLDGSRRDYAGCVVLKERPEYLKVYNKSMDTYIEYEEVGGE